MVAYSKKVANEICRRISSGETITKVCSEKKMPSPATIQTWKKTHPEFLKKYYQARHDQVYYFCDQVIDIADDATGDFVKDEKTGRMVHDKEHVNRARLRIDVRKWYICRVIGRMPDLSGTLVEKVDKIIEAFAKGEMSGEVAQSFVALISVVANIKKVDEFETAVKKSASIIAKKTKEIAEISRKVDKLEAEANKVDKLEVKTKK